VNLDSRIFRAAETVNAICPPGLGRSVARTILISAVPTFTRSENEANLKASSDASHSRQPFQLSSAATGSYEER
jgi:hypothetical protein